MPDKSDRVSYGDNKFFSTFTTSTTNQYRGATFAQPRAIFRGDLLSGGQRVMRASKESDDFNRVVIMLKAETSLTVPPRLPVALNRHERSLYPSDLKIGQMLMTGCVVLRDPIYSESSSNRYGQNGLFVRLTGTGDGDDIFIPEGVPLALSPDYDPLNGVSKLSQFAVHRLMQMNVAAIEPVANVSKIQEAYITDNYFRKLVI